MVNQWGWENAEWGMTRVWSARHGGQAQCRVRNLPALAC